MKIKNLKQVVIFKANPHDVYEALMDSKKHAKFSNSKANISREVGGEFTAYDGWINGKNLELIQDKKIVQNWRGNGEDWPEGYYSKVTFSLSKTKNGTKLTFKHEGIPESTYEDISKGWEEHYWEPMKEMLEK